MIHLYHLKCYIYFNNLKISLKMIKLTNFVSFCIDF